ncbi:hypothetical protein HU200_031732 [Digitaria exilis]|uniref:Uncharacterized protein n=1 Tax=Digitaria exilis TaxID=1010633 RepID=A0A835BQ92_9POAL|nr:hypothetical protein HU200_031732 [Digitaria exilis]
MGPRCSFQCRSIRQSCAGRSFAGSRPWIEISGHGCPPVGGAGRISAGGEGGNGRYARGLANWTSPAPHTHVAEKLAREAVDEEDAAAQDVNDNAAEVEVDDAEAKEVNSTTRAKVAEFAQSQDVFFARRGESYARLTNLGDRTSADGEIWRTCSSVNG